MVGEGVDAIDGVVAETTVGDDASSIEGMGADVVVVDELFVSVVVGFDGDVVVLTRCFCSFLSFASATRRLNISS